MLRNDYKAAFLLGTVLSTWSMSHASAQLLTPSAPQSSVTVNTEQDEPNTPDRVDDGLDEDVITVRATGLAGMTIGRIEPDVTITEAEISSYGVSSFEELLTMLEPLTGSGRGRSSGRPVILLNGIRVANFREIHRYPPEALQRVEILPEDVAVRYGYRADQRVVNFIIKPGFKSLTVELESSSPTAGGSHTFENEMNGLSINNANRTSIDGEYEISSSLLEREREIISSPLYRPFAIDGNVTSVTDGADIDSDLSALVGEAVTVASLPTTGLDALTLADFVPTANVTAIDNQQSYRTLSPESEKYSIGATHNRPLAEGHSLTISGEIQHNESEALLGLASAEINVSSGNPYSPFSDDVVVYRYLDPSMVLTRESETTSGRLSATMNGMWGDYRYDLIANYNRSDSTTLTDREADTTEFQALVSANDASTNPFGPLSTTTGLRQDRSESETETLEVDGTLNGKFGSLPAGEINGTARLALSTSEQSSRTYDEDGLTRKDYSRDSATFRGNVDLPIASRDEGVFPALGELSFDLRGEVKNMSDAGTLSTYGAGFRWSPVEVLTFSGSWRTEDGAATTSQLQDPTIETPNVSVFDFTTGETVEVIRISGGNADLVDDSRDVLALGARLNFEDSLGLTINTDYTDEKINNPISSFPTLTAEIEAAFPDRVIRVDGELVSIDARPVNYDQQTRRELRTSLNFRKRLEAKTPNVSPTQRPPRGEGPPPGGAPAAGGPPGGGGRGGPPGGGGGRGGPPGGGGRGPMGGAGGFLSASLTHTWALEETIDIRDGLPVLDLLDGSATGSTGGRSEHKLQGRLFYVMNGIGANARWNWQSATHVDGDNATSTLEFSDLSTLDTRFFVNLDQRKALVQKFPWLKGSRVRLKVDNVFDEKLDVRDADGDVPIRYQPDLLDSTGRVVSISFRKLFY